MTFTEAMHLLKDVEEGKCNTLYEKVPLATAVVLLELERRSRVKSSGAEYRDVLVGRR